MLTSSRLKVKLLVFVITVFTFAILGSTSNFSVSAFQSSPVPTSPGYVPSTPSIASAIASVTKSSSAKGIH